MMYYKVPNVKLVHQYSPSLASGCVAFLILVKLCIVTMSHSQLRCNSNGLLTQCKHINSPTLGLDDIVKQLLLVKI
jgi:hypothetical protein